MENKDCTFCKIIKGDIPSKKVYEDEKVLAFLDISPVNPGHTLIIPKEHFQWLYETPDNELANIFLISKKIMKSIKEGLKCDFVSLAVVGVDVPHFHIHLVPRYFDDGLRNFWPNKEYKEGEEDEVLEKIKNKQ